MKPRRLSSFESAVDSSVTAGMSLPDFGAGRVFGSGAKLQISSSSVSPAECSSRAARALAIAASIFLRLRTMPSSESRRATSLSP